MRKILPLTLVLVAVAAAGCGDAAGMAQLDTQMGELAESHKRLEAENVDLERRLDGTERRLAGLVTDVASVRGEMHNRTNAVTASLAAEGAEGAEEPGAVAASAEDSAEMAEFLKSDEGQQVLDKVMADAQQRRDQERRSRWVGDMVDRFATDNNLNENQTTRLKDLHTKMFSNMRDTFSALRDMGDATPEERAIAREEAMAQVTDARDQLTDDVKLILDQDQFAAYEEMGSRFGGFGGGRGGRGGGSRGGGR